MCKDEAWKETLCSHGAVRSGAISQLTAGPRSSRTASGAVALTTGE